MRALQPPKVEYLLNVFHHTARQMPWYRTLLSEHGVSPEQVLNLETFSALCPVLTKENTFDRFPLHELAATTELRKLATVLTSSGQGGRFSYGLSTREQSSANAGHIDDALDAAFNIRSYSTLAINCLPMGVGFTSDCMTVATTSVREDMAVALVQEFGSYHDQILLVTDPLFLKRLTDYAASQRIDWRQYRVHIVLGEEIFGENFRGYAASHFAMNLDQPGGGRILSSFGVAELGLHLCYETPATVALRRAAWRNPDLARDLLDVASPGNALPIVFAFNSDRTFIEIIEPASNGYGLLAISMLETSPPIPLPRYQTGDVARLLDPDRVIELLNQLGVSVPQEVPLNLIAFQGRAKEVLPNGSHVGVYKDALYADHEIARLLTGAFRLTASGAGFTMHVQVAESQIYDDSLEHQILQTIPEPARPSHVIVWPYDQFPFGMTLDYERKFAYYDPAEFTWL